MTELRLALHALVEHPSAAPIPVEELAARAARFTRRRRLHRAAAAVALAGLSSVTGAVVSLQSSAPGFVVAADGSRFAGYIAERPGGYVATGTWQLTITRDTEVIVLSSTSSPTCAETGTIQAGDQVRGSITGPQSSLRVGESFSCPG